MDSIPYEIVLEAPGIDGGLHPIRTGDILFYDNRGVSSLLIKAGSLSSWTHVAIAIWLKDGDTLTLCVFESDGMKAYDILTGEFRSGVRLTPAKGSFNTTRKVNYRKILLTPIGILDETVKFIERFKGFNYVSKSVLILSRFRTDVDFSEGIHCSELVAEYLRQVILLPVPHLFIDPDDLNNISFSGKLGKSTNFLINKKASSPSTGIIAILVMLLLLFGRFGFAKDISYH